MVCALILIAVFGIFGITASHGNHDMGCAYSLGELTLCAMQISYFNDWSSWGIAMLFSVFGFIALAAFLYGRVCSRLEVDVSCPMQRVRPEGTDPLQPTLFQQLYSDGILNRKEAFYS